LSDVLRRVLVARGGPTVRKDGAHVQPPPSPRACDAAATVIAHEALHPGDGGTPPLRIERLPGACRPSVGENGRVRDLRTGLR
jgi:hypothetical protein